MWDVQHITIPQYRIEIRAVVLTQHINDKRLLLFICSICKSRGQNYFNALLGCKGRPDYPPPAVITDESLVDHTMLLPYSPVSGKYSILVTWDESSFPFLISLKVSQS